MHPSVKANMEKENLVREFYREFFNGHDVQSAEKYVREDYIQHNPGVGQGRQALMDAFAKKFQEHPEFRLEIQMIIVDGDRVIVHLHSVDPDGKPLSNVVDWYRVQDGMLAEHWDMIQPIIH